MYSLYTIYSVASPDGVRCETVLYKVRLFKPVQLELVQVHAIVQGWRTFFRSHANIL